MKLFKCPNCQREHETEDNVKISFCPVCLIEMEEVKENESQNVRNK